MYVNGSSEWPAPTEFVKMPEGRRKEKVSVAMVMVKGRRRGKGPETYIGATGSRFKAVHVYWYSGISNVVHINRFKR